MKPILSRLACLVLFFLSSLAAYAQDSDLRVDVVPINDGLFVLFGFGEIAGNMVASIGADGVLVVDAQTPNLSGVYKQRIRELGGGDIDFVINSHWHFDHADGNKALGPDGAWIVAHENSRRMLLRDNVVNLVTSQFDQPAFPPAALPVVTYADRMSFHFNGQRIDLIHASEAHTAGDTATIFRGDNVVHMGDVFINGGYPFIDADSGGSLPGFIAFCEAVLAEIDPGTVVVSGHGPVGGYEDLADYVAMLTEIRERLADLIDAGASLDEVYAAKPTADWDDRKGDPTGFINRAYTSMTR